MRLVAPFWHIIAGFDLRVPALLRPSSESDRKNPTERPALNRDSEPR
jgi:hypothetical protein